MRFRLLDAEKEWKRIFHRNRQAFIGSAGGLAQAGHLWAAHHNKPDSRYQRGKIGEALSSQRGLIADRFWFWQSERAPRGQVAEGRGVRQRGKEPKPGISG